MTDVTWRMPYLRAMSALDDAGDPQERLRWEAVVDRWFAELGVRQVDKRVGELSTRQRSLLSGWLEQGL